MPPKTTPWKARCPTSRRARPARAGRRWPAAAARPPSAVVFHVELQPGQPGQPHLRPQPQQAAGLQLLDPPEVEGVADVETARVAPAPAQADPADQPVQPAAHLPGQRERVPAVLAADALDHPPQRLRRRGRCAACARRRTALPPAQSGSVGSGSDGAPGTDADAHRVATAESRTRCSASRTASSKPSSPSADRDVLGDVVLAADDGVAQRLDQRAGHAGRDGRDQTDPVAGQRRRERGTGTIRRRGRPATAAYRCIISS